jgi:hypothetical protein
MRELGPIRVDPERHTLHAGRLSPHTVPRPD